MNKADRLTIKGVVNNLELARDTLIELSEDLDERFDNVSEYFPDGPIAEGLEEDVSALVDAADEIDTVLGALDDY